MQRWSLICLKINPAGGDHTLRFLKMGECGEVGIEMKKDLFSSGYWPLLLQ